MISSQAKSVNLLLYEGDLNGLLCIEDTRWSTGEMYSAPKESVQDLIDEGVCNRFGVYLLLSRDRVYVGQSSDLAKRLSQHVSGKDWWSQAVVLTTKDDGLTHADIDYLESSLIDRALTLDTLDCDNKKKGSRPKVDRYREVFLRQYLDEALFLMELIGINVFSERKKPSSSGEFVDIFDIRHRLKYGRRAKTEALGYLREQGVSVSNQNNYSALRGDQTEYWLNPRSSMLDQQWSIVLNDTDACELIVLEIPAGTLAANEGPDVLAVRSDLPDKLDLHLDKTTFVDRRSGVDFSSFVMHRVSY